MISPKKAASIERAYRTLLYRRPLGIFSVLMLAGASVFAVGITMSAAKVKFPFYSLFVGVFSLLIVAIAVHCLLQALALLKKNDWTGVVMACLGSVGAYFGGWLLVSAITRFPE